jgi:hypothetical protein
MKGENTNAMLNSSRWDVFVQSAQNIDANYLQLTGCVNYVFSVGKLIGLG